MPETWSSSSGPMVLADRRSSSCSDTQRLTSRLLCTPRFHVMSDQRSSTVTLDDVADAPRTAWRRLRDELRAILGDDLVAMWAHGGTIAAGRQPRAADLDTYGIMNRRPEEVTAQKIEAADDASAQEQSVEGDVWYVRADDGRAS